MINKSELIIKKFTKTFDLNEFEILTDNGFCDVISLHETIPYIKYILKTEFHTLECADKHIVFDSQLNEMFVEELQIGDVIITENGPEKVIEIINTNTLENMYDFELSENSNHRYYTNGILSHNTFLIKNIAKMLGVPCHIHDCTKITAAGYVGEDIENVLTGLLQAADYDVEKAQMGIVCLDEIDKLAKKGENVSITKDVSGECVQQGLLKIVEGDIVRVMPNGGRKHPQQELIPIDTTNILFIGMGAFVGLDDIVAQRTIVKTKQIGFNRTLDKTNEKEDINILRNVTPNDLKKFGIIPELIGRFPVITATNPLSKEDLIKIIKEPKNSILKQYQKLAYIDGKKLEFTDEAISVIAEIAIITETGARGLRNIMETVLNDFMFDSCDSYKTKLIVDKDYCLKSLEDIIDKEIKEKLNDLLTA
jgi:ATP-dependent Clp protease ATP-binding subunit ClpX